MLKIRFIHGKKHSLDRKRWFQYQKYIILDDCHIDFGDGNASGGWSISTSAYYEHKPNRITIVWQNNPMLTLLSILHELGHWFIGKVISYKYKGSKWHNKYDDTCHRIYSLIKII